jgi:hypothetical protein
MTDLIDHLLAERHRIPNQVIIDCLVLARLQPMQDRKLLVTELQAALDAGSQSSLSQRLGKVKRYGLLDYERGYVGDPGYRITRVGPA